MDRHPTAGPLRAFRDRYVASFMGLSYDLAPGSVGVHPDHVADAPDLPGRHVLVSEGSGPRGPLDRRPVFQVVLVERLMRNANAISSAGGVVFSCFDLDTPATGRWLAHLRPGQPVYLNASVERLWGSIVRRPPEYAGSA